MPSCQDGRETLNCLISERACEAWGTTWEMGKSFEPTLSWFLRYHIVHKTIANSSRFLPSACMKRTKSLNHGKLCSWRNSKPSIASQTSVIFRHSHKAWQIVSGDKWQCSQTSLVRIFFFFHRLRLTRIASRQVRHKKFLTLFGTGSPQIRFQMSSCCDWLTQRARRVESLARNFVPNFTKYTNI